MTDNYFDYFKKKLDEEVDNLATANIMIIGKTGVGKSTLINHVFRERLVDTGIGRPITQHLSKITKKGMPLTIYDTKGLELDSTVQQDIKEEILLEINSKLKAGNPKDYLHVLWYCINANSNRIEDFEGKWIEEFAEKLPVMIVLTQCMGNNYHEFLQYIRNLNLPITNVVPVLAEPMMITNDIILPSFGLTDLVDITYGCIDDAAKRAFINAQKVNIEKKVSEARMAVLPYVTGAFATGFTPIPFADTPILVTGQIGMIAHLTAIFGINIEKTILVSLLSAIGGAGGAAVIGKTIVANALKFIPGLGTLAGGMISGSTAAIITSALGFAYVEVMSRLAVKLYQGETIEENEIVNMMKRAYQDQLKQGRKLIKDLPIEEDEGIE